MIIPKHDDSLMPMTLGPVTRVPEYALSQYGVHCGKIKEYVKILNKSEKGYAAEWKLGTKEQMQVVSDASVRAGFGDKPQMLREKAAEIVSYLAGNVSKGKLTIYEHGAGPGLSAKTIFEKLSPNDKNRVYFFLIDPAKDKLFGTKKEQGALQVLEETGLKNGRDFTLIADSDLNSCRYIEPNSVDFFVGVASLHHHSHIPFEIYYNILDSGGYFVSADWHNSIWEEPYRYYKFLERFKWPKKKKGLQNFLETYPRARFPVSETLSKDDKQANEDITKFWLGYHELLKERGQLGRSAIWPSEGHRPVWRYQHQMWDVGFDITFPETDELKEAGIIDNNPHQNVKGTTLWMTLVGKKD